MTEAVAGSTLVAARGEHHSLFARVIERMAQRPLTLVAIGAIALLAGVIAIDNAPVGVFHDDAMYVILARSLASGQGYRYLNLPGAPTATHFPPGYPAVLALLSIVAPGFPGNVLLFKLFNVVCLCGAAVFAARLVKERTNSEAAGVSVGLLSAVSVPLLILGSLVLSEPLFLALLLVMLISAERLVDMSRARWSALWLGLAIGALALVRTHGGVLAVVLPILLGTRRRWRDAMLVLAGAAAVMLPWQLWSARQTAHLPAPLLGNYGSYLGWWVRGLEELGPRMLPETVARTGPELLTMITALASPSRAAAAHVMTWAALAVVLGVGGWNFARRAPVSFLFMTTYLAITLLWPFPPSRFVWGIWPLVIALPVFALVALRRSPGAIGPSRVPTRALRLTTITAVGWLAIGYGAYELRAAKGAWWGSIARSATPRIAPAIEWTLANTSPRDVVASDDEGAIYLYTGRRSVPLFAFTPAHYLRTRTTALEARDGLVPILSSYPVRFVIVGSDRSYAVTRLLAANPLPLLAAGTPFPGGVAYTVLQR